MPLYLVGFSTRLRQYADAARTELEKWGATRMWDDVWLVEMDHAPETCLPGLVQTEAAFSIPLANSDAFFSISRSAGIAAQLAFTEKVMPLLHPLGDSDESLARVHYCNDGAAVFAPIVARYMWMRRHNIWATELCRLMAGHGSDKGIGWHTYTPFYQELFAGRRDAVTALFELGLGTNNEDVPSNMGACGTPGASLRAWRDYFPSARVFGADVDRRVLFSEHRIETFFVDQRRPETFATLWSDVEVEAFDFFLDDGLHTYDAACITFENAIGKVKSGGYYIIEDVLTAEASLYLEMVRKTGLAGLAIDIGHPSNIYDNCLVIAMA